MGILWTLLIGLVAGALAKFIMPGRDPGGILVTMLLGVAGAFVAGFLGRAFGWYTDVGDRPGLIAAVVGAIVLLGVRSTASETALLGASRCRLVAWRGVRRLWIQARPRPKHACARRGIDSTIPGRARSDDGTTDARGDRCADGARWLRGPERR